MSIGSVHDLGNGLHVVEGHHPHTLWDDPDIPSVAVYRRSDHVYLFDTGAGPEQRGAILELVGQSGEIGELRLLNSHGHVDHLGNNDLIGEIPARSRLHRIARAARPALDHAAFFRAMYEAGVPYFDYRSGLDLGSVQIGELPGAVVDILLRSYPPVHSHVDTMRDYEDDAPAGPFELGGASWTGWAFTDDAGEVEVYALESGGHSAGGLVFYLPHARTMLMANETTAVPIWADSDPVSARATAERVLMMIDAGLIEQVSAGHRPLLPVGGGEARAAIAGIVRTGDAFVREVESALSVTRQGLSIDELFLGMRERSAPGSVTSALLSTQFPVFATFVKLTLLNHCRYRRYPESVDSEGVRRFALPPA